MKAFATLLTFSFLFAVSLPVSSTPIQGARTTFPVYALDLCRDSVNCKVVDGEPHYDFAKRDMILMKRDEVQNSTVLTADDGTVDTSNCAPSDMVHSGLYDNCFNSACKTDTKSFDCPKPGPGLEGSVDRITCTVAQDGEYAPSDDGTWWLRNMFVDILESSAKARTKQKDNTITPSTLGRREAVHPGSPIHFKTNVVPKSVIAVHYSTIGGQKIVNGHMRYTISCQSADASAVCSAILGAVGDIADLLLPGSAAIAGILSSAC